MSSEISLSIWWSINTGSKCLGPLVHPFPSWFPHRQVLYSGARILFSPECPINRVRREVLRNFLAPSVLLMQCFMGHIEEKSFDLVTVWLLREKWYCRDWYPHTVLEKHSNLKKTEVSLWAPGSNNTDIIWLAEPMRILYCKNKPWPYVKQYLWSRA